MTSENNYTQDELIGEALEAEEHEDTAPSLYQRIGEDDGIHCFVEQFYHAILSEPILEEFFEGRELEGLKAAQKEFLAIILGGRPPLDYWDIITSDAPTNLSLEHTDLMIEYAEAVLTNMDLGESTIKSIVRIVSPFIEAFINGSSKFQRVNSEIPEQCGIPCEAEYPESLSSNFKVFDSPDLNQMGTSHSEESEDAAAELLHDERGGTTYTDSTDTNSITAAGEGPSSSYDYGDEETENARMFRDLIEKRLIESQSEKTPSAPQMPPSKTSLPTSDDSINTGKDTNASETLVSRLQILLSDLDSSKEGNLYAEMSLKGDDLVGKIACSIQSTFSEFRSIITSLSRQSDDIRLHCDELKQLLIHENERRLNEKKSFDEQPLESRLNGKISQAYKLSSGLLDRLRTLSGFSPETGRTEVDDIGMPDLKEPLHALISHNQELQALSRELREASGRTATLALNAALEAVRAGQQGKCFNVIASEMKEVARNMDDLAGGLNKTFKACRYYAYESLEHMGNIESSPKTIGLPSSILDELQAITELLSRMDLELSEEIQQKQNEELNKLTYSIEEKQEASRFAEKLYQLGNKAKELKSILSKYAVRD